MVESLKSIDSIDLVLDVSFDKCLLWAITENCGTLKRVKTLTFTFNILIVWKLRLNVKVDLIQRVIKKYFKFRTLNRVRNFYLIKHMMNSDTSWFQISIVKIPLKQEISKDPRG